MYAYLVKSYWEMDEHTYGMVQDNFSSYSQSLHKNILSLYARTSKAVYI